MTDSTADHRRFRLEQANYNTKQQTERRITISSKGASEAHRTDPRAGGLAGRQTDRLTERPTDKRTGARLDARSLA